MISELGMNIKKYREKKGLTISKLKEMSGVGYATLHDIENGKTQNLNSTNLEKVATALEVGTNELLGLNIIEHTVTDLKETLELILESDELTIDDILVDMDEKEELMEFFDFAIEHIRIRRSKNRK